MLDVIVGCTRKTEVRLWRYLFQYAGRPKDLFERCMERDMLKSAGGYLLVLHTLEHLKDSSQVDKIFVILLIVTGYSATPDKSHQRRRLGSVQGIGKIFDFF